MNKKEITTITVLQITEIMQVPDEQMVSNKDGYAKTLAADLKKDYGFDDVVVLSAQQFILDNEGTEEQ